MGDYVKMAVKGALILTVFIALAGIVLLWQVPSVNFAWLSQFINKAYTIVCHWCPVFESVYTLAVYFFGIGLTVLGAMVGLMGYRSLMKIFE